MEASCWDSDSELEDAVEIEFVSLGNQTDAKDGTKPKKKDNDEFVEIPSSKPKKKKDKEELKVEGIVEIPPSKPKKRKMKDEEIAETPPSKPKKKDKSTPPKPKKKNDKERPVDIPPSKPKKRKLKEGEVRKEKKKKPSKKDLEKFEPVYEDAEDDDRSRAEKLDEISAGLSPEQKQAVELALGKNHLFITGPAGTGKSRLIKAIYDSLTVVEKSVRVTAYTGVAASNLSLFGIPGVTTFHSWMGTRKIDSNEDLNVVIEQIKPRGRQTPIYFTQWLFTDVLIIDECSMLPPKDFIALEKIARTVRPESNLLFGGLQVIFVGDFFQLPPACWSKHTIAKQKKLQIVSPSQDSFASMCFQLKLWEKVFTRNHIIVLKTNFRQKQDAQYGEICDKVREGLVDGQVATALLKRVNEVLPTGQAITRLVSRNNEADRINAEELQKLEDEETVSYQARLKSVGISEEEKESLYKSMKDMGLFTELLELKIGASVILRRNIDTQRGLSNGAQGIIRRFQPSSIFPDTEIPVILFNNGLEEAIDFHTYRKCLMKKVKVPSPDEDKKKKVYKTELNPDKLLDIVQLPLALAFAITIHKSQSLTLDNIHVDLDESMFASGQAYIALSRVRRLENLFLGSFDQTCVKVDRAVVEYYRSLDALLFPHLDNERKYGRSVFEDPKSKTKHGKKNLTPEPQRDFLDVLEENLRAQQMQQPPPVKVVEPKKEESSSSEDSDDSGNEDEMEDEDDIDSDGTEDSDGFDSDDDVCPI